MLRKLREETYAQFGIMCIIMFIVMLVGGGISLVFLMPMFEKMGQCLLIYVMVPMIVMVVLAILVKRYLLGGKGLFGGKKK